MIYFGCEVLGFVDLIIQYFAVDFLFGGYFHNIGYDIPVLAELDQDHRTDFFITSIKSHKVHFSEVSFYM